MSSSSTTQLLDTVSQLYHCADCNYCVDAVWQERQWDHICPTLAHHSPALSYSGKGYMNLARAIHEGAEFPLEDIAERVFTCTNCGNCERVCPIGLSPRDVNVALREMLVINNAVPPPLTALKEKLTRADNAPNNSPSLDMVNLLFLSGCETEPSDDSCFELVKQFSPNAARLNAAGKCCGANLATLGFTSEAMQAEQEMLDDMNIYPYVENIVLANPKCKNSFRNDPRLISLPAWFGTKINNNDIQVVPKDGVPSLIYMDACTDPDWNTDMRKMLDLLAQQGCLTLENPNSGSALAMCCGAGGGLPSMATDSAKRMSQAKMNELQGASGSESILLIADPGCLAHMKSANEENRNIFGIGQFLTTFFHLSVTQADV